MKFEELYAQVKQEKASHLYNQTARLIEAKRDFIYLAKGDTPEIRQIHERANQMAHPLMCAYGILEATGNLHLTIEEHMNLDPEICSLALDALVTGMQEFQIESL